MFVHIVFWRLHDPAPNGRSKEDNAREMKRQFEAMPGVVPGLLRCEVGINSIPGDEASDVALYSEFENKAAFEAYYPHPAHQEVVKFIKGVRSERRVVDWER
jgi:hypothetical protein